LLNRAKATLSESGLDMRPNPDDEDN